MCVYPPPSSSPCADTLSDEPSSIVQTTRTKTQGEMDRTGSLRSTGLRETLILGSIGKKGCWPDILTRLPGLSDDPARDRPTESRVSIAPPVMHRTQLAYPCKRAISQNLSILTVHPLPPRLAGFSLSDQDSAQRIRSDRCVVA